ncbi:hypothetical protein J5N97_017435 [Dioscorea zingiberensis]|uniref:Transcription elongation factor n=1 Tax=Dioscorea zingiberensis TaxID=325984 RepID=A0A9D5CLN9_9LILI|nr:hypothetical protein J5N97_017435 [Dioscorea zingiberensis]
MEKELLDTFAAAKKAADAAASDSSSAAVDRCVDALQQLRRIPVNMKDLVNTQVGKRLRALKKHPNAKIQAVASDILEFWKTKVIEESSDKKHGVSDNKNGLKTDVKSERSENMKDGKTTKAATMKTDASSKSEDKAEKTSKLGAVKSEKNGSTVEQISEGERTPIGERHASDTKKPLSSPAGPPRLTTMIKCKDPQRDKVRGLLAEAFAKVSDETSKDNREEVRNILDEVDACDPIRVAVTVESVLFEKLGHFNGSHKVKFRSIMFNLRDDKNPDFRRRVLLGLVKPEILVDMAVEEMASDERKLTNKQIKDKALFDCERAGAPKATTDQFKCGRCGQRKATYYQLQTRSADEPMTTFVTCVNCNNHWKFC